MKREYHRWYSPSLAREMELLLFGHGGEPVILLPTSKGRFFQYEDFGLIGAVADQLAAGRYVVLCPDSVDDESWFNGAAHPHDRLIRHEQYESYLINEVVPLAWERSSGGRLALGGCSFGGFHAINIGLRQPRLFQKLLSMGGKFETEDFLHGYHDLRAYFHGVFQWLPNLADSGAIEALRRTEIILAAGEHDFCCSSNERLSALLWQKAIGHHLAIWPGEVHDWPVWRQMAALYLPH